MQLESQGIIIGLKNYGERALIARVLTQGHGVLAGIVRGGQVSKNRLMVGQLGHASWSARLESHLGTMKFAPERNLAALLMNDEESLSIMNSAFAMIADFLPEREAHEKVYFATLKLLAEIPRSSAFGANRRRMTDYLRWETELLSGIGYSLDFSKCAGCGCAKNLTHLSPKTGRAVCESCAAPHIEKLFSLPLGLSELEHFFNMFAVKPLPKAREYLFKPE
ncbi:MAG: DNA repair protein RecO [Rickettsiales bacterium]|jgi:DNA repair protein RecO (recombination protein O)|nr:DNA repair protein RecO [Rickettsiales bacterium]